MQSLTEDAPDLLKESITLVKEFQNLVGGENQAHVAANPRQRRCRPRASCKTALDDFSTISRTVSQATGQISTFTDKLDPIAASVGSTLGEAEKTLASVTAAFDQAHTTLATADGALKIRRWRSAGRIGSDRQSGRRHVD